MKVFFTRQVEAGFDAAKVRIGKDMKVLLGYFVSDYKLADFGYGELKICANVTGFERMDAFMMSHEKVQLDKNNLADYKGYSLSEIKG